jgi:hypothetical protein
MVTENRLQARDNDRKRIARREANVWPDREDLEEEEGDATSQRRRKRPPRR